MNTLKKIRCLVVGEDAATAVEYAVLLAMILVAVIIGVTSAGGGVSGWWTEIKTDIESY